MTAKKGTKERAVGTSCCFSILPYYVFGFLDAVTVAVVTSLKKLLITIFKTSERFEPRSHFINRLSMIVWANVVLNRTVVDSD